MISPATLVAELTSRHGGTVCNCLRPRDVALSSGGGGGELSGAVKWNSEGIGLCIKELFSQDRGIILSVDARASKGALLRACTGEVQHLEPGLKKGLRLRIFWNIRDPVAVMNNSSRLPCPWEGAEWRTGDV